MRLSLTTELTQPLLMIFRPAAKIFSSGDKKFRFSEFHVALGDLSANEIERRTSPLFSDLVENAFDF
jgi:hypothetical protein